MMGGSVIRALVADEQAIFRVGMRQVIETTHDIQVVAEASHGRAVLELLALHPVDIAVVCLDMPVPSGPELVRRIRARWPRLPMLGLSASGETDLADRVIRAGADGYLTKDVLPETLVDAIRSVARGAHVVTPSVAARLLFAPARDHQAPHRRLSEREFQVFVQLARGSRIGEIARELSISAKTVSTHKQRTLQKLGLRSDTDLVRYALQHGLAR